MSELRQKTIDTYNQSAKELAEYFRGIGPRVADINLAFELAGNPEHAKVLEIGCGDGRDAKDIVQKAEWYQGFDVSEELIKLANEHVPEGTFDVADANEYVYPENLDVVFAFASLLHLNPMEIKATLDKVHQALRPEGIFYISLKHADEYKEEVKEDQFGTRLFYFYNPEIITELARNKYISRSQLHKTIGSTKWFEIALQKN